MAEKLMIEKSDEFLYEFFRHLSPEERKHIGLMGGWAVHYLLKGKDTMHMGSRDIDIFFDPKKISPETIKEKLEALGFRPHSTFRWLRIFHSETEKELSHEESKKHPIYNLAYIYFDVSTPTKTKHSMPEPMLKKILKKEHQFITLKNLKIMVPSPKALIEMKLRAGIQRTDAFKRTKDIADLYALLDVHSELWIVKNGKRARTKSISRNRINKFKEKLARFSIDGTLAGSAAMLKKDQNKLADLLEKI